MALLERARAAVLRCRHAICAYRHGVLPACCRHRGEALRDSRDIQSVDYARLFALMRHACLLSLRCLRHAYFDFHAIATIRQFRRRY